jgi:glycosyltransferase involved in cell wall biosynthesis
MPLFTGLRIAVALPHLGVYGGIRRFLELGAVWQRRGHRVALLTPPAPPGGRAEREPWLPFAGETGGLERLAAEAWDVVLSPDPDLFARVESPGALHAFYAVLEGAPGAEGAWRRADLVLANSTGMARHLSRRGIAAADGIGGVNLDFFKPPAPDPRDGRPAALPAGAALPADSAVQVLVYGRLSRRRKGTWIAARAVARAARRTGVAVELTLFDSPPRGAGAGHESLALGIPYRWEIGPSQEELADLYRGADLFVSAERRAGWSNTAAEAMACGAAVVCTPSGTEDFARHGETALVARWPWTWLVERRVAALLGDAAARRRLAARGLEAIARFGWERTADRLIETFRERIERMPRREGAAAPSR